MYIMPMTQQKTTQIRQNLHDHAQNVDTNLKDQDAHDITTMDVRYEVTGTGDVREIKVLIGQGPRTELHLHSKELHVSRSGVTYKKGLSEHDELLNALGEMFSREVVLK